MKKPLIFITNDDGFNAPGFKRIVEVARRYGRVVAVAPETMQSGMSQAITMHSPIYLEVVDKDEDLVIYSCTGTPVDCVKIAYDHIFLGNEQPTLNVSGINHGSNSAINVLYSGTMGAAIEASFYSAPSVGFSLDDHSLGADFDASVIFADRLIPRMLANGFREPVCLNVNIPVARPDEIKGHRVCRQNKGYWKEKFYQRQDPRGKDYYWLTGGFVNQEPEATDTDEWALANGYISIVPIQVDMTHYGQLGMLNDILE